MVEKLRKQLQKQCNRLKFILEPLNSPYIYFEVVSKDTWSRYRTEGLTYKALPILQPGVHVYDLQCLRVTTGKPSGELRRFFIGDCSSYNDITWTGIPRDLQVTLATSFSRMYRNSVFREVCWTNLAPKRSEPAKSSFGAAPSASRPGCFGRGWVISTNRGKSIFLNV